MCAVKVAVGVDHLRLDPQAEVHAKRVNFVDQGFEAVGKLLRIYEPIAKAGMVVFSLSEPAIIHDKAFDTKACRFFGEDFLSSLIDVESGCLPRVVDDGARARFRSLR